MENLIDWNPWWEKNNVPKYLLGLPRKSYNSVFSSMNIRECILLTGIRRSGKSTLMYQLINELLKKNIQTKQILMLNFEDESLSQIEIGKIYEFYKIRINPDKKSYLFLDEIHKKSNWEKWIRKKYDLKEDIKFIISGSSSHLLKKEYSELLTGRNLTFEIYPLSFAEFLNFNNFQETIEFKDKDTLITNETKSKILYYFERYLIEGGFPEVALKEKEFKNLILKQYFEDIIFKDISTRNNVNSQKIRQLSLYFINNITSKISLRTIRNITGLSYDTIKYYLYLFNEAYLFFTLEHFSFSIKEQKTHASKIYCIDNGLRNSVSLNFTRDYGKLAENMFFLKLKKEHKDIYYYDDKNEVDFIIKNNKELTAINVTYTDEIKEREIKGLIEFKKNYSNANLIIITKDIEKKENNITYIPMWKYFLYNNYF